MSKPAHGLDSSDDAAQLAFFGAIASRDRSEIMRLLDAALALASRALLKGATRQDPGPYFIAAISHHVYAGDTSLHVAAAAHQPELCGILLALGADAQARNRRGAQPIHYAADGNAGDRSGRAAQREAIACLIEAGADPDAVDNSGVAPLHRAVRTRSSEAVSALIEHGANPLLMNKSGSTPLHLAVQNTGSSNSGSDAAKDEQRRIIALLREHGASLTDIDSKGRTVAAAASSDRIRRLLDIPLT